MPVGNPQHPVTKAMDGNWHSIAALLMMNQGLVEFTVTGEMTQALAEAHRKTIVADTRGGGLIIRLVSDEEGKALMKDEGLRN